MKRTFYCLVIVALVAIPVDARRFASGPLDLVVDPANVPEPARKYQLILNADEQTDADAVPLYEKAIQTLPRGRTQDKQVREWLKLPPEQLLQKQVEEVIRKHMDSLRLLARAARCKQCNWPKWKPGTPVPDQKEYFRLLYFPGVRAEIK